MSSHATSSSSSRNLMETTSLIKMLDCPVCQQVAEPPILMCQRGHSICHKCRVKVTVCPLCQGEFSTARNLLAEEMVLKLHQKCPNSRDGCVSTVAPRDWESHITNCDFRQIECDLRQGKSCQGTKMNYRTYFKHLQNVHGVQGIKGNVLNVTQFVTFEQSRLQSEMPRNVWPVQYMEAYDELFVTGTAVVAGKIYWWLYLIGAQDLTQKYVAKISISLKSKGYDLSWIGPVHSFRTPPESILQQGLCLLATPETLYPFIHIKIQQHQGKLLASQEGHPNLGWNITFSLLKKEKMNAKLLPAPSLSQPTMPLLADEILENELATLRLEASNVEIKPEVGTGKSKDSASKNTVIKKEPEITEIKEDFFANENKYKDEQEGQTYVGLKLITDWTSD